jgi:ribbon-helix-helix CopG family protein
MRTTLTIDDDVAAQLERLRRERDVTLKDIINEALR